jgi:zinc transport system ATP-binding protein
VLETVNLDIPPGSFTSLVGPNGGGKTTLFKIILGLLKPNEGSIQVLGEAPGKASQRIGYVPQHINYDRLFPISVLQVVLMGRITRIGRRYSQEDRRIACEALEEMDLGRYALLPFSSLSGGQQQRVLIARALCSQPEMLLMDEPTANIDKVVENKLFDILKLLNKRMTILIISHDLGFVSSFVDQVICVNRTVAEHPTTSITGEVIQNLYDSDVHIVRHDHVL